MGHLSRFGQTARRAPPPVIEVAHIFAPTGGLNTVSPASMMPPGDCLQLFNLVSAEYGLRSRLGYREWCTNVGTLSTEVRSILPFTGSTFGGAGDKLFATTVDGIWDVTTSSTSPSKVLSFGSTSGDAGLGICHAVVTSAGHFLLYCDELNGLHVYTASTDTWAAVTMGGGGTQINGVDPASLVSVTVFKSRVWFTEKNSARAWYLAAGAIYGTATQFEMGTKFRAGGSLVGLWNWTMDGGAGIDDKLVAISAGGDIVVWGGTDPASATTFGMQGVWYAGAVPSGRRIATNFGGELLLLSTVGVLPLSKLLSGNPDVDRSQYATTKIGNLFNALAMGKTALKGWSLRLHPEDNSLIVTIPQLDGTQTNQLVMSLWNKSWSQYRDLPIYSAEAWSGKLYFGTVDGKVCINDGYVDGVTLASPDTYTAIQWACLTSFQNLGNGRQKRIQMIRPTILAQSASPSYQVAARYKYDLAELSPVALSAAAAGSWGVGLWGTALWAGEYATQQAATGAYGMGPEMAVAIRGTANSRTVLIGMDVFYDQGGLL